MKKLTIILVILCSVLSTFLVICWIYFNCNTFEIGRTIEYQTKSKEFVFSAMPSKGRDHEMMEIQFSSFKKNNPDKTDLKLYRTTMKNYLDICKWKEYRTLQEWDYPYLAIWSR